MENEIQGFKFNCSHCQQRLEAPLDMAGEAISCPTCNREIVVPRPPASAPPPERKGNGPVMPGDLVLKPPVGSNPVQKPKAGPTVRKMQLPPPQAARPAAPAKPAKRQKRFPVAAMVIILPLAMAGALGYRSYVSLTKEGREVSAQTLLANIPNAVKSEQASTPASTQGSTFQDEEKSAGQSVPLTPPLRVGDLSVRDYLGHTWTRECITFPLNAAQCKDARKGMILVDADNREVASQFTPGKTQDEGWISVQTDLTPYQRQSYRFSGKSGSVPTDLEVRDTGDQIQIVNSVTGLRIRKSLAGDLGPIAGVRLMSGIWTCDSTFKLSDNARLAGYTAALVAKGPVFAEVECRATFADGGWWVMRFRVESGEPAVIVHESYDAPRAGVFNLVLGNENFRPTHMLNRHSDVNWAGVQVEALSNFHLEPWIRWNDGRRGNWLALYTPEPAGSLKDMLMIGLLRPSLWINPQWKGKAPQAGGSASVSINNGLASVGLPVAGGQRVWILGVLDKSESIPFIGKRVAPPPQKLVIKHGDIPLNTVKDWILEWEGDDDNHPVLFVKKADLPRLRSTLVSDPKELERWRSQQPVDKYMLDGPIKEFIVTADPQLGKRMADKAEEYLQTCVDWYIKQDYLLCPGTAPHMQSLISTVINLVDPVLSTPAFTPEQRKRFLAKLAFIGYILARDDYWSPERGYSGFANMTSVVALYRTGIACILPSHPMAKSWAKQGLGQLAWQLTAWSDEDGGWVEAPHYAMVSFDHMLAGFTMAANAGLGDYFYHPRMRKVVEWFAGISTPRDSRSGGFRHQPPIGNTYPGEPNGVYGLIAYMWKDRDPEFAAQMQWLFEQHGSILGLGNGWNFPAMLGYRFQMGQSGVTPKPAKLGSALYRNTGAVLRNTMQSDRETYLHIIGGGNHSHYDCDSGSIILYGKGRVLCDDWGYFGLDGGQNHSMLGGGGMSLDSFGTCAAFDQVSGTGSGWIRQIGFAKDADPLGPTFFFLRDINSGGPQNWRLWLTGSAVNTGEHGATLIGEEDVDMDILIRDASRLKLSTSKQTRRHNNGFRQGREQPIDITQTCLQGTLPGQDTLCAILYPRLKNESTPTVSWHADGRIAQVTSEAGTDYVFLSPKKVFKPRALEGLAPLPRGAALYGGCRAYTATEGAPFLCVNDTGKPVHGECRWDKEGFTLPAGALQVHPGSDDTAPVTIVWQSPESFTVTVDVQISDDDRSAYEDKSDGVRCEIRKGGERLAEGSLANAGLPEQIVADGVSVAKGEIIRIVILPNKCSWFDATRITATITSGDGRKWDLAEAVGSGKLNNDHASEMPQSGWWACMGDGTTFDMRYAGLVLVPLRDVSTLNGLVTCKPLDGAQPFLNLDRSVSPAKDEALQVHPAASSVATLAWRSPVSGKVAAEIRVKDLYKPGQDNPEVWRNDGIRYELHCGNTIVAQGTRDGGDWEKKTADGLTVNKGDVLRLVIYPGASHWWDSTAVDMTVTDASGKKWNAREDLITRKMKLGNEMGADQNTSIWWACAGDAPRFAPEDLIVAPMEEVTSDDGKVRFQGTAGAVQIRGGKVSLALGAPGRVIYGRHELAADGPEVKTIGK